jgi:hypothetical protein
LFIVILKFQGRNVYSVKAEVPSDAETEAAPDPITFPGIKAEPEVSCFSVSMLGRIY